MASSSQNSTGALPADMPPPARSAADRQIAKGAASKLLAATKGAHDPQLKATFSQSLATLHQYLAQDQKAQKQAQARKVGKPAVNEPKPQKKSKLI